MALVIATLALSFGVTQILSELFTHENTQETTKDVLNELAFMVDRCHIEGKDPDNTVDETHYLDRLVAAKSRL